MANSKIYKVGRDQEPGPRVKLWLCRLLAGRPGAGNCASVNLHLLTRKRGCGEEQTNILMERPSHGARPTWSAPQGLSTVITKLGPFVATRRDLEGMMLSEINQREEGKYCRISHTREI